MLDYRIMKSAELFRVENISRLTNISGKAFHPDNYLNPQHLAGTPKIPSSQDMAFIDNYIKGLKGLTDKHQIRASVDCPFNDPMLLLNIHALGGYAHILGGNPLEILRTYRESDHFSLRIASCDNPDIEIDRRLQQRSNFMNGEWLGLVVMIAERFGYTLKPNEVPREKRHFFTLMEGLTAQPKKGSMEPSLLQETFYRAGLKAWLAEQGITDVEVDEIRHPYLLRHFKHGLAGNPWVDFDQLNPCLLGEVVIEDIEQKAKQAYQLGIICKHSNKASIEIV